MIILPAIDIKNGTCVRLLKGEFDTAQKVAEDPIETAAAFSEAGAKWLHMVDLDAAKTGLRVNRDLIVSVVNSTGLKVELGGGIRDLISAEDYINHGVSRVIIGSAAVGDTEFVKNAVKEFGDKIAVGIDARDGYVATKGWVNTSQITYLELAEKMEDIGVKVIIFTDISCDGTLEGPNFKQLEKLKKTVSCKIIASGGIRNISNIKKLNKMNLYGAICGKSIYSGTLSLSEAVREGGTQDAC